MTLVDLFGDKRTKRDSGITFIANSNDEDFLSYQALYTAALGVLSSLQKRGVTPGATLVLQVEDNKNFLIVFWACILGGIIPVPVSIGKNDEHRKKLDQILSLLDSPFIVVDHVSATRIKLVNSDHVIHLQDFKTGATGAHVHQPKEEDIAFIQFSSGSTGSPKGVMLTHGNLIANVQGIGDAAGYNDEDSLLSWMPLTHDMGMIGFHINPLFYGINQYLIPTQAFVRNPMIWLDKLSRHGVTVTCSPNFGYRYLLKYLKDSPAKWDLSAVRIIYNGAEPISERICHEFNKALASYGLKDNALCPVYGLAEASVAVSISSPDNLLETVRLNRDRLNPGDTIEETFAGNYASFVNVGRAIKYCAIRITDAQGHTANEKVIGEIKIKGANVTSGYYRNSEASREVFDQQGWLNTGDLGFIKDGSLYVTGRAKDIIFINGQNFYSHDLEKETEDIDGIELNKIAFTGVFNPTSQKEDVLAFVFHRGSSEKFLPLARALKKCIGEKFGFELTSIIPVPEIPRTTSGKLQRFKLLKQYQSGLFAEAEKEVLALLNTNDAAQTLLPSGPMEVRLYELWQQLLLQKDISVNDSFFAIGGDSLKATELVYRIQQEFEIELSVQELFTHPTIRAFAARLPELKHNAFIPIPRTARVQNYPASPVQKRIYYAWKMDPESVAYNVPVALVLQGQVTRKKLEQCLNNMVNGHDTFCITFTADRDPRLCMRDVQPVVLAVVDCPESLWPEALKDLILPFDLVHGPLFRFKLLHDTKTDRYVLLLDFHHSIFDGQSAVLFINELLDRYNNRELQATDNTFADYAVWRQSGLSSGNTDAIRYWQAHVAGEIPTLQLPLDKVRPTIFEAAGKRQKFTLDTNASARLKQLAGHYQVTHHTLFLVLYHILLSKFTGQEDVIIGIPASVRNHPSLLRTQGMFTNSLPIRNSVRGDDAFSNVLVNAHNLVNDSLRYSDFAFDQLLDALDIAFNPTRSPLFDTMFLYQNREIINNPGGALQITRYDFDPGFSKFDLSFEATEANDHFAFAFEYATALFEDVTIRKFAEGFLAIVHRVIENPQSRVADLFPFSEAEYHQVIVKYNDTNTGETDFRSVVRLFEHQVDIHPDQVAMVFGDRTLSYAELNGLAENAADVLWNSGVRHEMLVGIHLERSVELVAAILGVFKCGAAYLPLESEMLPERMNFILADSECHLLVTDSKDISASGACAAVLSRADLFRRTEDAERPTIEPCSSDLAYIIYTSGTTGTPKGVMIEQGALSNYIRWAGKTYLDTVAGTFALYSSISFDLTITSIFTPLTTGDTILVYREDVSRTGIEQVIRDNRANIVKLTPSHLRLLRDNDMLSSACCVKRFIVGGEALDTQLARDVCALMPEVEIYNEYGPTQATVGCMIYRYNPADHHRSVPIGVPIANTQIYILDQHLKPVPVHVAGEIYISGNGLARGYRFREELTDERFINNPYVTGQRMYKTGDQGRRLPDGNLEFIGRNDRQVKVNGNRVELSEIEATLVKCEHVRDAAVLIDREDANRILAYYVPDDGQPIAGLQEYLSMMLPYYMIPREFHCVESIPLTRNGKVDEDSLSVLSRKLTVKSNYPAASELEQLLIQVWKDVLKTARVDRHDNFFELGGDSIKAVQISSRLLELGLLLKVKDILIHHSIEFISRYVVKGSGERKYEQGFVHGEFLPTAIQSWFLNQGQPNPHYYHHGILLNVDTELDTDILSDALTALVRHHDSLRVNYDTSRRTLFYNSAHLQERILVPRIIVGHEHSVEEICTALNASFDAAVSLLIKMVVLRKEDNKEVLFITAHHLIVDGVSWRILLEDFYTLYASLAQGQQPKLPHKTASFIDWQASVSQVTVDKPLDQECAYWTAMEAVPFTLSSDFDTDDWSMENNQTKKVRMDSEATDFLLRHAHRSFGTDVNVLLNVALVQTLQQWTAQDIFVVEQENHGRYFDDLDTSRTIGWFTALYPVMFSYKQDIGALIKSVKETLRNVPFNGVGYGLARYKASEGTASRRISEIRFNYLGQMDFTSEDSLLSLQPAAFGLETDAKNLFTTKLEINAMVLEGIFQAEFVYNKKSFRDRTVEDLALAFISKLSDLLHYLRAEDDIHFTPSDFTSVDLDEAEIEILFQ